MRSVILGLVMALVNLGPAAAQAPRDVLLDVCNDTGVVVAVASAYATDPTSARVLRSWFLVQPATCLEGALNNVVGDSLDLHVMSGEFRWPAGGGDNQYCVPASSYFGGAASAPCRLSGQQLRDFKQVSVQSTRLRGRNGTNFGRASYRIDCSALAPADAPLCRRAPTDERGLAQPVRELEYCNNTRRAVRVTAFADEHGDHFEDHRWSELVPDACALIYRGFPEENEVLIIADPDAGIEQGSDATERVCLSETGTGALNSRMLMGGDEACPTGLPSRHDVRRLRFGAYTHRHTAYVNRN